VLKSSRRNERSRSYDADSLSRWSVRVNVVCWRPTDPRVRAYTVSERTSTDDNVVPDQPSVAIIDRLVEDAKRGRGYAMKLVLDHILPQVNRHEVELPGTDAAGLIAAVERAAKKSRR
jgi:hypothetical protein